MSPYRGMLKLTIGALALMGIYRLHVIVLYSCLLASCGGGSGNDTDFTPVIVDQDDMPIDQDQSPSVPDDNSPLIAGGSPSSPVQVDLSKSHEINNNIFYNYFKYEASEGERIAIHASLTIPMSFQQVARCSGSAGNYDAQIIAYDSSGQQVALVCGMDLNFVIPKNDTYTLYFNFPFNGSGFFDVASTTSDSAIQEPTGRLGSPSNPISMLLGADNVITENTFLNYFHVDVATNDELILYVSLDIPMSQQQHARCSGAGSGDQYETRVRVYNSTYEIFDFVCGEAATFLFPSAGNYILHFNYASQSAGKFNADILR